MARNLLLAALLGGIIGKTGAIPLSGYFCASCPSSPNPTQLINDIPKAYSTVIFAFIGFNPDGTVVNQWDAPDKNFTLTKAAVATLRAAGRNVLVSMGGADGGIWPDAAPPSFVTNMANGVVGVVTSLGLDGIDFDIESRSGDLVKCGQLLSAVISALVSAKPGIYISFAPQMTDIYPALNSISAGFNAQLPPVNLSFSSINLVQLQMYNTWAQAETISFAEQYTQALLAGYSATASTGQTFSLILPARMIALGFPASPNGAGSGFIKPTDVCAMICAFKANGTAIALMTWDIGWDEQAAWEFSSAVAAAGC